MPDFGKTGIFLRALDAHGILPVLLLALFFAAAAPLIPSTGKCAEETDLNEILEKTSAYCERVKQAALYYVCQESISDKENILNRVTLSSGMVREARAFSVRRTRTQSFVYDYQLVKKEEELKEQRILLEENGKKRHKENAQLKQIKYFSRYLVYGPVGFLSSSWQVHFTYAILGEESLGEEKALILRATPVGEREENNNIGKIWIGPDFQILRIEWEPVSIQNYEDEAFDSRLGEFKKTVKWTVDYGIEKNGVRFPSRQVIQGIFIAVTPRGNEYRTVKHETVFEYSGYKFFVVETEIKYETEFMSY